MEDLLEKARRMLKSCRLCGHGCGADRLAGETGECGAGARARVAAHLLHFGEEPPLSGTRGSGTIFFSHCPLTCVFCQNFQISQEGRGEETDAAGLATMMLELEAAGAHNLNLVSPTPWVPQILEALTLARGRGFGLPVVYNTGGYDSLAALRLLEGVVDVFLPDAKYADPAVAEALSGAENYPAVNRISLSEMHRQAGPLKTDDDGLARRGMLVRHLVLPQDLAQTKEVLAWLARAFGPEVPVSLMAQYLPSHQAREGFDLFPALTRPLTFAEYEEAMDQAMALGMENVFIQELSSAETYAPDFGRAEVFERRG
jgi:putative pyruvate formate lyase activating enzyme